MAPRALNRTLGVGVVKWIEQMLVHGPGDVQGQPIELNDEQVRFLCRAYEIDANGRRVVRRAVFSRSKGWAKSEFAAMIVCAEALGPVRFRGWDERGMPLGGRVTAPFIPIFATESDQAGDLYGAAYFMLREGPLAATRGLDVGLTRTYLPDGGKVTGETSKATSKDGGKETFAAFDETHLFTSDNLIRLHSTVRRNLGKRNKIAETWALETSTMYAPGENSVAEASHAYAQKIKRGEVRDAGFLFDHRQGPTRFDYDSDEQLRAALIEAYGEAAAWVDVDRVVSEARDPQTERSDVMRYFVNVPSKREAALFVKASDWDACETTGCSVPEGALVALGADGSRSYDTTVIAWASPTVEGRIRVGCRIFSVRAHVAHHVLHESGTIDFDDVEGYVLDRFDEYEVVEAAYDPNYLDRSAELLERRLPDAVIYPVEPTSKHMREALGCLERAILDHRLEHDGDDRVWAHFANTRVERGEADTIRRVAKMDSRKPIDVVPALALAVWRASVGEMAGSEWEAILA